MASLFPGQLGEGKKITGWPVLGGWERTGPRVAQFDPCTTAAAAFRLRVRYGKKQRVQNWQSSRDVAGASHLVGERRKEKNELNDVEKRESDCERITLALNKSHVCRVPARRGHGFGAVFLIAERTPLPTRYCRAARKKTVYARSPILAVDKGEEARHCRQVCRPTRSRSVLLG